MNEPQIGELSHESRKRFFLVLVVVFLLALPVIILYSTGYRLSFENDETTIVSVGGIFVTTDNLDVEVYLDEERVERPRFFRSAYYIQNISNGQHRVVVQRPDLQTWVKELPVDPHIVIEAAAFNMPVIPHVRPITEYVTDAGTSVIFVSTTTEDVLGEATSTVPIVLSTSTTVSAYELNEEYVFVHSLFSTTSTSTRSVFEQILDGVERFRFATTSDSEITATATEPIIERNNIRLIERDGELYAVWGGGEETIPYYFCVIDGNNSSTTALRYGDHVATEIERFLVSTTTPVIIDDNRLCRSEIRLDRKWQDVYFYDFFPNSSDLVLIQLEDGLYVTEIDDRAWQNTQQLYPGHDLRVVVENDVIYIQEGEYYFEIITEIEPA